MNPTSSTQSTAGRGRRVCGFTLVEMMTVIAVIAILLGVTVMGLAGSGGPKTRQAARGEVVAMLTRARSHAIASGVPTALVVIGTDDGPAGMRGKALGLYEVRQDAATGAYEPVRQLRRWVSLPGRTMLLGGPAGSAGGVQGINVMDQEAGLRVEVPSGSGRGKVGVAAHAVVFEATGAVRVPPGSGRLEFLIGEGTYGPQGLTVTAKNEDGSAKTDRVMLSRLTGRARSLSAKP